jgi:hypothetical protein
VQAQHADHSAAAVEPNLRAPEQPDDARVGAGGVAGVEGDEPGAGLEELVEVVTEALDRLDVERAAHSDATVAGFVERRTDEMRTEATSGPASHGTARPLGTAVGCRGPGAGTA